MWWTSLILVLFPFLQKWKFNNYPLYSESHLFQESDFFRCIVLWRKYSFGAMARLPLVFTCKDRNHELLNYDCRKEIGLFWPTWESRFFFLKMSFLLHHVIMTHRRYKWWISVLFSWHFNHLSSNIALTVIYSLSKYVLSSYFVAGLLLGTMVQKWTIEMTFTLPLKILPYN